MKKLKHLLPSLLLAGALSFAPQAVQAQSAFDDPMSAVEEAAESLGKTGGGLVAVENPTSAGSITVGSTAQVVVLFRNEGVKTVEFQDINLYPSSNVSASVQNNACDNEPLEPAAECAVILSVRGVSPGEFRLSMLAKHSGVKRLVSATITGSVIAGEESDDIGQVMDIELIPSSVEFGSLTSSRPVIRSVSVRNVSAKTLDINEIKINSFDRAGFSLDHNCGDKIEEGESCLATITWAPLVEGPVSGFLVVSHSGKSKIANSSLSGSYSAAQPSTASIFPTAIPDKGLLISDMTSFDFGSIQAPSALTATIVNSGDGVLTLKQIFLSEGANGIEIAQTGCALNGILKPTEACALTLKWRPAINAPLIDNVQILHDGARGVFVMPVSGEADLASLEVSQPTTSEGNANVVLEDEDTANQEIEEEVSNDEELDAILNEQLGGETVISNIPVLPQASKTSFLQGYRLSSLSTNKATISGAEGSKLLHDGQPARIAGILWNIKIKSNAVEFRAGKEKATLYFDHNLSLQNNNPVLEHGSVDSDNEEN